MHLLYLVSCILLAWSGFWVCDLLLSVEFICDIYVTHKANSEPDGCTLDSLLNLNNDIYTYQFNVFLASRVFVRIL